MFNPILDSLYDDRDEFALTVSLPEDEQLRSRRHGNFVTHLGNTMYFVTSIFHQVSLEDQQVNYHQHTKNKRVMESLFVMMLVILVSLPTNNHRTTYISQFVVLLSLSFNRWENFLKSDRF